MRRVVFPVLGLLELAAALALIALTWAMPSDSEVRRGFEGARKVTSSAEEQLRIARREVEDLRKSGLSERAEQFAVAMRTIADVSEGSRVDFEAIAALRDGLDQTAEGLETMAGAIDADSLASLGSDLHEAADVIDARIVPTVLAAADRLEAASGPVGEGARQLAEALGAMPLDLAPIREIRDGIARLDEGLAASDAMLDPGRLATIGDAAGGAEGVVVEAARMAERSAGYSYPVVEMDGLTPRVRSRPFWPRARQVGSDLRRVAAGMDALEDQAAVLARELPTLRDSIAEGRRGLASTSEALDLALDRQVEVDRLLDELPARVNELAEALPRLGDELAEGLRGAGRLTDLATSLREAGRGIEDASNHWPRVRSGLVGAADVLRAARNQADLAIRHRPEYESAIVDLGRLSGAFTTGLPEFSERLDEQAIVLRAMAGGIGQFDETLPAYELALTRCLKIGRGLAWLVATIAVLHGIHLIAAGRPTVQG